MCRIFCYSLAGFLFDWSLYLFLLVIPFRAEREFHASELTLGLLLGLSPAVYTILCTITGSLADRRSRPHLVRLGCLLFILNVFLVRSAGSMTMLFLCMPVLGVSGSLFWPSVQATIGAESPPETLERNIGIFNILWSLGKGLGFLTAGAVHTWMGSGDSILLSAMGPILILFLYPRGDSKPPRIGLPEDAAASDASRSSFLWIGWIANFFTFGFGAILATHLFKRIRATGGGEETAETFRSLGWFIPDPSEFFCGWVMGVVYLSQTLSFAFLAFNRNWTYRRHILYMVELLLVAAGAAFALPSADWILWWAAAGTGVALGFGYASSIYYSLHRNDRHGTMSGWHEAVLGGSNVIAPLLAGSLATWTGNHAMVWWCATGIAGSALVLQEITYRRLRKLPPPRASIEEIDRRNDPPHPNPRVDDIRT